MKIAPFWATVRVRGGQVVMEVHLLWGQVEMSPAI